MFSMSATLKTGGVCSRRLRPWSSRSRARPSCSFCAPSESRKLEFLRSASNALAAYIGTKSWPVLSTQIGHVCFCIVYGLWVMLTLTLPIKLLLKRTVL